MKPTLFVYGSILDSLECEPYIKRKRDLVASALADLATVPQKRDPYDVLLPKLQVGLNGVQVIPGGMVPIDDWLRPVPRPDPMNLMMISLTSYRAFNDSDGPYDYSKQVQTALNNPETMETSTSAKGSSLTEVLETAIPLMLGVDHSASGGAIRALAETYGRDELVLVVFDYHTDFLPMHISLGMSQWDMQRKGIPWTEPPRKDSYGAGSFLYNLLQEEILLPHNIIIIGSVPQPTKALRRVDDPRVQAYIGFYDTMIERGVQVLPRLAFKSAEWHEHLRDMLRKTNGSKMYVSFDMDVGVLNSFSAVRVLHFGPTEFPVKGIGIEDLLDCMAILRDAIDAGSLELVGLDFMEFDTLLIDRPIMGTLTDSTSTNLNYLLQELLSND